MSEAIPCFGVFEGFKSLPTDQNNFWPIFPGFIPFITDYYLTSDFVYLDLLPVKPGNN